MLFGNLNLTPKGKQLLEHKDLENLKIGRIVINTVGNISDMSDPATVAALEDIAGASACFAGFNHVGKSKQISVRMHAPQALSALNGQLRLAFIVNEDIAVTEDPETAMPRYKVFDKENGSVLGWSDMIESGNAWTSTSSRGFAFDAVITVLGDAPSRCNFKDVLSFAPASAAAITNADICQHDVAAPSISARLASAEAVSAVDEAKQEARAELPEAEPEPEPEP